MEQMVHLKILHPSHEKPSYFFNYSNVSALLFTRCDRTALAASLTGHCEACSFSASKVGVVAGGGMSLKNALFEPELRRVFVGDGFKLL